MDRVADQDRNHTADNNDENDGFFGEFCHFDCAASLASYIEQIQEHFLTC
jgi:hypothetical protein